MSRVRERARTGSRRFQPATAALAGALLAALPPAAQAQSQWDVLFHGSGISYEDSEVKNDGYAAGFYGTYGTGWKHLVEVGATRTGIAYADGWDLRQTDVSLAYSHFGSNGAGRVGIHLISSNDPYTHGGLVLFGGASRYRVGVWSAGAEAAMSSFPSYDGGLTTLQLAPSVGFTAYNEGGRSLGATFRAYAIHLSKDVGLESRDFLSAEAGVSFTVGTVTLSGYAWSGEQAFAVRNGGFMSFNLPELHTGGYGGALRWVMTPRSALSAGLYVERFRDMEVLGDAWARTFAVSLGFTL
ncbi:MAG: hypothetical protein PVJ02_07590 [Gemmatimonadota bacterium]|jgi:hypothetical protein